MVGRSVKDAYGSRHSRILVVEDEQEVREPGLEMLGRAGYHAVGVDDGREAVQ